VGTLATLIKEGKFDHIGLSEVSAPSIRRAYKIHPIATVEIEYSLWSTEAKTNGVLETAKDLGIAIVAYSPLGRGILTGKWKTIDDVPALFRERFPRYSMENFEHNKKFLDVISEIAEKKRVAPAQVAISWVLTVGDHVIPIPGSTNVTKVKENMGAADLELTKEEIDELNRFTEENEAKGERYGGAQVKHLWG
jgi:pyridoxine 4-dehydrogenase